VTMGHQDHWTLGCAALQHTKNWVCNLFRIEKSSIMLRHHSGDTIAKDVVPCSASAWSSHA
jgi:hypothetical protein